MGGTGKIQSGPVFRSVFLQSPEMSRAKALTTVVRQKRDMTSGAD